MAIAPAEMFNDVISMAENFRVRELVKKIESHPHRKAAKFFTNADLTLSQSRITSSRRGDLVVLGTANLKHRKSISWPTMTEADPWN